MAMGHDFRQRLTDRLIQHIEENDGLPWRPGWDTRLLRPFNPSTGVRYKGGNVLNLLLEQLERESDDPRWLTLRQANAAGYRIRKGAKAAYVEYWDWGQPAAARPRPVDAQGHPTAGEETEEDEEEEGPRRKPRVFFAAVFNGGDIDGLPDLRREIRWQPNAVAEQLIAATGAVIEHTAMIAAGLRLLKTVAFYSPARDLIVVPPRSSFTSEGDYYATVLHELGHWTGHPARLARRLPDETLPFGSPAYAQEELRAEIASLFLTSMLGIEGNVPNHAKYTAYWLDSLKADKHEIFRAARDAEKIVDYLFESAPELRDQVESRLAENRLPQEEPKRTLARGVSDDLPNFIPPAAKAPARPPQAEAAPTAVDPRWAAFEQLAHAEARRSGVEAAVVDRALALVKPKFTAVMDAAATNGHRVEVINARLARALLDEIGAADVRQRQWDKFCGQVRHAGAGLYPPARVEQALQTLGSRYRDLIDRSNREAWSQAQTDGAIRNMIFGEGGRRRITGEYVQWLVEQGAASASAPLPSASDDDDLVLLPFETSAGADEAGGRIARCLMDDAEVPC